MSVTTEFFAADALPIEQLRASLAKECTSCVPSDYLQCVASVFTPESRQQIVEWMAELSRALKQQPEALSNAVCNLDRFIFRTVALRVPLCPSKVALFAATALLLASKQFDTHPVPIALLCSAGRGAFSEADLRHSEVLMLQYLEWHLLPVTAWTLMHLLLQSFPLAAPAPLLEGPIAAAEHLCQLTLREAFFIEAPPSITGLACVASALSNFGLSPVLDDWLAQINQLMEIPMDVVTPCFEACNHLFAAHQLARLAPPSFASSCPTTAAASPSESPTADTQDMPVDVEFSSFLRSSQSDISIVSLCSRSESAFSDTRSELLSPHESHFSASSPSSQFGQYSSHAAVKGIRDCHDAFEAAYALKDTEMTASDTMRSSFLFSSIECPSRNQPSFAIPLVHHPIPVSTRGHPEPYVAHSHGAYQ